MISRISTLMFGLASSKSAMTCGIWSSCSKYQVHMRTVAGLPLVTRRDCVRRVGAGMVPAAYAVAANSGGSASPAAAPAAPFLITSRRVMPPPLAFSCLSGSCDMKSESPSL